MKWTLVSVILNHHLSVCLHILKTPAELQCCEASYYQTHTEGMQWDWNENRYTYEFQIGELVCAALIAVFPIVAMPSMRPCMCTEQCADCRMQLYKNPIVLQTYNNMHELSPLLGSILSMLAEISQIWQNMLCSTSILTDTAKRVHHSWRSLHFSCISAVAWAAWAAFRYPLMLFCHPLSSARNFNIWHSLPTIGICCNVFGIAGEPLGIQYTFLLLLLSYRMIEFTEIWSKREIL